MNPSLSFHHSRMASIFFFANQHKFKKRFHHNETSSCVSRAIAKRSNWVVRGAAPGRERNGNVMLQLTLAIFPVFFPELIPNTMVFNLSHYLNTIRN